MKFPDYPHIKQIIGSVFSDYIEELFLQITLRDYYYWNLDFFINEGNLSFQLYELTSKEKTRINDLGENIFTDDAINFKVNPNSHRHDINIRNIAKLFASSVARKSSRYGFIKEFILWQILEQLGSPKASIQKTNFLYTYVKYCTAEHPNISDSISCVNEYKLYERTAKGRDQIEKLEGYEASTEGEVINNNLLKKIRQLYVRKTQEEKLEFVFSFEGAAKKEELRELLDLMSSEADSECWYRGQANASWVLNSSLTRDSAFRENEKEMYYEILSLKPNAFKDDADAYQRMITMQHYGLPTRLLDITRNPLISIFFACSNMAMKNNDGSLYCFTPSKDEFNHFESEQLQELKHLFEDGEAKEKSFISENHFIKGIAKNQRISSQSGDFIFIGKSENSATKLQDFVTSRIIIDSGAKKTLLEQLEVLNIHPGSVYPDLTHMSNFVRTKFEKISSSSIKPNIPITTPHKADEEPELSFKGVKKPSFDKITEFASSYNLDIVSLEKLIDSIILSGKTPFKDEIIQLRNEAPSLHQRKIIAEELTRELLELLKED